MTKIEPAPRLPGGSDGEPAAAAADGAAADAAGSVADGENSAAPVVDGHKLENRLSRKAQEARSQFAFLVISVVFTGFSAWLYLSRSSYETFTSQPRIMYPAGIVFIFALAASSYVLLTQWRHYKERTFKILAAVLVFVQLVIVIVSSVRGTFSAPDLSALLAVLVFGLLGMSIGICVPALLIRGWPYAESAILGAFAIMVAILCLPGIFFLTRSLVDPGTIHGKAYVFATGAAAQRLQVDVVYYESGSASRPGGEQFSINNNDNHATHWAVLLDTDARIASFDQMPGNVTCRDVRPDGNDGIPAQLCTGVLAGTKSVQFSGTSAGLFESWTFDRAAISLPTYGQGTLSDASRRVQEMITTALGGAPTVRNNGAFTLTVDAGQYDPAFQSLSNTQPTVDPSTQSMGRIYWLEHETISNPQFEVFDQNRADEVTFGIAVYAVFLGIAGAGLVTSLQGIVKTLISRTSATSTTLASSANPSAAGAQVTYTATVSPAPNGGTVTFRDGTAAITSFGSAPVDTRTGQAICQMPYTGAGSHTITAAFSGDREYKASTSAPLIQTVNKATPAFVSSLSANPIIVGGSAHGTATLDSTDAGGTVDYRYYADLAACQADVAAFPGTVPTRGTDAGTVTVSGGSVPNSAPATFGSAGTVYWAAFYSGDTTNAAAASCCDAQQVAYQVKLLHDQAKANHSGSTVPIELQLLDAVGANVSASGITVTVTSLSPSPAPGESPTGRLTFLPLDHGLGYQLNVKTTGYPAGTYTLSFTADTDPTTQIARFVIS